MYKLSSNSFDTAPQSVIIKDFSGIFFFLCQIFLQFCFPCLITPCVEYGYSCAWENIGDFEYIARKYDIDYSLKRDRSGEEPCYRVFFRARDWETLFNALEEYARRTELRRDRAEEPLSVQRQLERYRETARIRSRNERTRIPRYREELR